MTQVNLTKNPSQKLAGKVAVITGGNSGIGLATAQLYRDEGADVVITASSDASFEKAQKEWGDHFTIVQTDVTSLTDLENLSDTVKRKFGKVDVLFANAGIAHFSPTSDVDEAFFDRQFDTNVKGTYFTVKNFLPLLSEGASVLLTTSGVNTKGLPGSSVYAATKAALRSLARTLAADLSPRGIRVNALSPGPVETPIYSKMGWPEEQLQEFAGQIQSSTPIGRFGSSEEIAKAALFLASEDSSFVLGAELVADGGFSQL